MGDINADYLKPTHCKELKQIISTEGFDQLITKPTRVTHESSTLINVIIANKRENISFSNVYPIGISDHDLIGCVRKLNHRKYTPRIITCRNYTNYDHKAMCTELSSLDLNDFYDCNDVNRCWNILKNKLSYVYNKHAPMMKKNS